MTATPNPIDDASALKKLVINLYTGWGYNAYRHENKDRADDLLVRNGVCSLLVEARTVINSRATAIRHLILIPSREVPFPGAQERAQIAKVEQASRAIEAVEALIRYLPVPENDATWLWRRVEREFLPRLMAADESMVGEALQLRELARTGADLSEVARKLEILRTAIESRKAIL